MARPNTAPAGYTAVTPWIVTTATGQLLDFITAAFDRRPGWPETPSMLRMFVADADATMDRAVAAGATKECDGWLNPNTPRR